MDRTTTSRKRLRELSLSAFQRKRVRTRSASDFSRDPLRCLKPSVSHTRPTSMRTGIPELSLRYIRWPSPDHSMPAGLETRPAAAASSCVVRRKLRTKQPVPGLLSRRSPGAPIAGPSPMRIFKLRSVFIETVERKMDSRPVSKRRSARFSWRRSFCSGLKRSPRTSLRIRRIASATWNWLLVCHSSFGAASPTMNCATWPRAEGSRSRPCSINRYGGCWQTLGRACW